MHNRKGNDLRVLFILKFREDSGGPSYSHHYFSSGLFWSAKFVADMLQDSGVTAKVVEVVDNNDIDREVTKFQPDVVIIEALWVVPDKFDVLKKLHPNIKWVVRLHSNVPFLANEGIAISWIKQYAERGVQVAVNDKRMLTDLQGVLDSEDKPVLVQYLPNFYPVRMPTARREDRDSLDVACFGAIRPLKNQLIQAVAAIRFADEQNKQMWFHINASRVEMGGNCILENLRSLFVGTKHYLIEHAWVGHAKFLHLLEFMDLGMQVSLSETFSIVAADMVNVGIPVVVSKEVGWSSFISQADPTDSKDIVDKLHFAAKLPGLNIAANRRSLKNRSKQARKEWLEFLQ